MTDEPPSVRHVLYSHYGAMEREDFAAYNAGASPDDLPGVQYLASHFRGLRELLTTPGHEGLLVLYYAPGFEEFLMGLSHGDDNDRILNQSGSLKFADAVARCVRARLKAAHLEDRVRFLT